MPIQDVRDWISETEAMGELTRVDGVDPHLELGGLVDLYQWDMENPALLFDHIKGLPPRPPAARQRLHLHASRGPQPQHAPRLGAS